MPLRQQLSSSPRVHLLGCEFLGVTVSKLCPALLHPLQLPLASAAPSGHHMGLLGPAWTRGCPQTEPCKSWGSRQVAGGGIQSSTGAVHTQCPAAAVCPMGFWP